MIWARWQWHYWRARHMVYAAELSGDADRHARACRHLRRLEAGRP